MKKTVIIDFETYYHPKEKYDLKAISVAGYIRDPRFKVHGLAAVDLNGFNVPVWYPASTVEYMFKQFSNGNELTVVAHNVKFDGAIAAWKYGLRPARWIDTKAMSLAVLGNSVPSHSLSALAKHFGLPDKGVMKTAGIRDLTPEQEKELAEYCKHDAWLCAEIYNRLRPQFPPTQYWYMDWSVRCFTEPRMLIDVPKAIKTAEEEAARRAEFFNKPGFEKVNFSSNQKFAALLQQHGYEVPVKVSPRTKKEIPALAVGDVEFLEMAESDDPTLRELCEARIAAKSNLLETRAGKLAKIGATGPWPFDVQFSGAAQTHRFSGGAGGGGNPQNLSREGGLRESVVAPEGHVILSADFSNIELRIVAYLAQDRRLIKLIEDGADIYCDFASQFYRRKITKADEKERRFGKCAILGLGYGMGPKKFMRTARLQTGETIDHETAERTVALYRNYYLGVPRLWDLFNGLLAHMAGGKTGQFSIHPPLRFDGPKLILPSGLEIKYPELKAEGRGYKYKAFKNRRKEPEWVNVYGGKMLENLAQALAGEICKETIAAANGVEGGVLGMVHDELLAVVPERNADERSNQLSCLMGRPPSWWPKIRLACEVGIGHSWAEAK